MGMACALQISAALTFLIVGGPAMQLTENGAFCDKGLEPYDRISKQHLGVCIQFCVPSGKCEDQVQTGELNLGVTGQGYCKFKGYTESAPLDYSLSLTSTWLENLQRPCNRATVSKFETVREQQNRIFKEKLGEAGEGIKNRWENVRDAWQSLRDNDVCPSGQIEFEAFNEQEPGICSIFCAPTHTCAVQVRTGAMNYLGFLKDGGCKGEGYTEPVELNSITNETVGWFQTLERLKYLQGPCMGMSLSKFQKPNGTTNATATQNLQPSAT